MIDPQEKHSGAAYPRGKVRLETVHWNQTKTQRNGGTSIGTPTASVLKPLDFYVYEPRYACPHGKKLPCLRALRERECRGSSAMCLIQIAMRL